MNSPVEERLREALVEAAATIDPGTLRPLRVSERRRFRVDVRLLAVAVAVVLTGAGAAVGLRGGDADGVDRVVATDPDLAERADRTGMAVFMCAQPTSKDPRCEGRAATAEEVLAVERRLRQLPQVEAMFFVDRKRADDNFRKDFAHNRTLLAAVRPTDLPVSFRLAIRQGAGRGEVRKALGGMPGVSGIVDLEVASAAAQAERPPKPRLAVFLCVRESPLPACGAERERQTGGEGAPSQILKYGEAATRAQTGALQKLIASMPNVRSFTFESRQEAYENFRRTYRGDTALLQATKVEDMPQAFRLLLTQDADWVEQADELRRQPGVGMVVYGPCTADQAILGARYGISLPESTVCPR